MTRQRFIHPELWADPTVSKLTPTERLMFIGMFSNADDEGIILGSPAYLRSVIFPYDDIPNETIRSMRDKIASVCKNMVIYAVDDTEYIIFTKWDKYQNPRYPKPSRHPKPSQGSSATKSLQPCNQIAATLQPNGNQMVTTGRDGMGRDGMGREDTTPLPPSKGSVPYQDIVNLYNSTCLKMPRCTMLTEERKRHIRARWNEHERLDVFTDLFTKAAASDFLNSGGGTWKGANFDWLLKPANFVKVLEGNYDNGRGANGRGGADRGPVGYYEPHDASHYEQFTVQ